MKGEPRRQERKLKEMGRTEHVKRFQRRPRERRGTRGKIDNTESEKSRPSSRIQESESKEESS